MKEATHDRMRDLLKKFGVPISISITKNILPGISDRQMFQDVCRCLTMSRDVKKVFRCLSNPVRDAIIHGNRLLDISPWGRFRTLVSDWSIQKIKVSY